MQSINFMMDVITPLYPFIGITVSAYALLILIRRIINVISYDGYYPDEKHEEDCEEGIKEYIYPYEIMQLMKKYDTMK